jgi:hypothetical protein
MHANLWLAADSAPPRRAWCRIASRKQTLAKPAGLSVAFGFAQRLFVCRACWWRRPESYNRQSMYHQMSSQTLNPFCSSEHSAGSSAWSKFSKILARHPLWLAASYVSRSCPLAHPQPCRTAFPSCGTNGGSHIHVWLMLCPLQCLSKTICK